MARPLMILDQDGALRVATLDDLRDAFRDAATQLLAEARSAMRDDVQFATVAEAATALGCDESTVKARILDGALPAVDLADPGSSRHHWRVDLSRVARLQPTPCTCSAGDPTVPCRVHPTQKELAA